MNKNPLVSCIITTYKRTPEIVERALKSIVNQTYDNLEIILVNDYPEDKDLVTALENVVKKYNDKRKIEYIVVEKNGGACKARNIGIKKALGEYVACLDDDDEWLPEKIKKQVDCATQTDACIVYCNSVTKYIDLGNEKKRFETVQPSGNIFHQMLYSNLIGSCSFPLIKKSVLESLHGFREDMPAMQDFELYLRITKSEKASYIDDVLAVYYSYDGERISRNYKARSKAYEIIYDEFYDVIENDAALQYRFKEGFLKVYTDAGDKKKALKYYWNVVKLKPFNIWKNAKFLLLIFVKPMIKKRKI